MTGFLIFLGLASVVTVIFLIGVNLDRKRSAALEAMAPQLGLAFAHSDETGLQSGFTGFHVFSQGRGRTIRNIMYGRLDGDVEVMLFYYSYTTGSGKNRTTRRLTVGFFQSDSLSIPEFVARPENV